jgi:hypothetical protein
MFDLLFFLDRYFKESVFFAESHDLHSRGESSQYRQSHPYCSYNLRSRGEPTEEVKHEVLRLNSLRSMGEPEYAVVQVCVRETDVPA